MLKVIVVCLVVLLAGWVLSNPQTYFRKECPTTRLPVEGVRIVQRFSSPSSGDAAAR